MKVIELLNKHNYLPVGLPLLAKAFYYVLFALLIFVLLFAPLPKAGTIVWGNAIINLLMAVIFSGLLLLWLYGYFSFDKSTDGPWFMVWFVCSLVIVLQLFILPKMVGWGDYINAGFLMSHYKASPINPLLLVTWWASFCAYWCLAWFVSKMSFAQCRLLMLVVIFASLFQAIYGIYIFLSEKSIIIGLWSKEHYLQDVTGTFVNRNHFAGFLSICWPIALNFLLTSASYGRVRVSLSIKLLLVFAYSFLIALAWLNSHSRMGVAAGLFGLLVWSWLRYGKKIRQSEDGLRKLGVPLLVVISILLLGLWFGVADLFARYMQSFDHLERFQVWWAMFDLPWQAWVFGIGPGGFEDVFRLVHPEHFSHKYVFAHNDYLQFVLELGLLGTLPILYVGFIWFRKVFPQQHLILRAGAIGGVAAIVLHSLMDFNLHIPGSAIYFWLAVGLIMNRDLSRDIAIDEQLKKRKRKKVRKTKKNRPSGLTAVELN